MLSKILLARQPLLRQMSQVRNVSSIQTRVLENTIFMPAMFPSKLTVPINESKYELTIHPQEFTGDFEKKVTENCPGVTSFKILSEALTLGEVKRNPFKMQVNSQTFNVYPDLRSVLSRCKTTVQNKDELHQFNEKNTSLQIGCQTVLTEFYDHFVTAAKS